MIARATTDEGPMTLWLRGDDEYEIRMERDRYILMSSRLNVSEAALGRSAIEALGTRVNSRILLAGLGMGFTLRAALDALPGPATVVTAELNPIVVEWCRGPLAALTDAAVDDPRVDLRIGDVGRLIAAAARGRSRYDAIVLDLYQGVHEANDEPDHPFFSRAALDRAHRALTPGGVLGVWTEESDASFEKRLGSVGFSVRRIRPGRGGPRHAVYLGIRD